MERVLEFVRNKHISSIMKRDLYIPFSEGDWGLSPAGGGWGWPYVIKNHSKTIL